MKSIEESLKAMKALGKAQEVLIVKKTRMTMILHRQFGTENNDKISLAEVNWHSIVD
jgi:hypothetical protein